MPTYRLAGQAGVGRRSERRLTRPVTLTELKADPAFATSMLVRQSRLSVVRLDDEQLAVIERRAGEPPPS